MRMTWLGKYARPGTGPQLLRTAAACVPLLVCVAGTAQAQRVRVTGTVANPSGTPLGGVSVRVVGDTAATVTTQSGRYTIQAPANASLRFASVGYQPQTVAVGSRTAVDVTLQVRVAQLSEVVVQTSGYGGDAQRRSQISGAVASVNVQAAERQTSSSVAQRLDATVSGVTVNSNGSPGSRSTVRVRGISSFQNNNPLYVIDGTPVQDDYINFLNPEDIASIQVLKDASAASIYGSRASNGVIIIETKKRGASSAPRATLSVRQGIQNPINGYDKFLITNPLDYFQVIKTAQLNSGLSEAAVQAKLGPIWGDINHPTIPQYTYAAPGTYDPKTGVDQYGRPTQVNASAYNATSSLIMPGSSGTDWWKAVFGTAPVSDVNLGVSGAGTGTSYAVSFNYFDQTGTAAYNRYRRGSVRANTQFTRGRFQVGENLSVIGEGVYGGLASEYFGEGGFIGKNILMQPVVPIYDISGNFASGKANTLGNNTNPLKSAYYARNNTTNTDRFFGNVFASYDVTSSITLRTQLGGNVGQNAYNQYTPTTFENAEPNTIDNLLQRDQRFNDFTWSNTARFSKVAGPHNVAVLVGQEINRSHFTNLEGSINGLISNDINSQYINSALGTLSTPYSYGNQFALLSYFGKADYTFKDRYVATVTVRRDGSSNLGPSNRWGTFPAAGLAWHASREAFLADNRTISDLQFRVGYGVTGNQQIPSGRTVNQYGGTQGGTSYNIGGTGTALPGYRLTSVGNPNLKWESNKSVNAGFDLGLFNNNVTVIADYFNRTTNDLLFNPVLPGTAGAVSTTGQPFVNIGAIRNAGYDFTIGHSGRSWSLNFNGSHYSNRIVRIDGVSNFFVGPGAILHGNANPTINEIGQPIGAFYGLVANGYFQNQAEIDQLNAKARAAAGRPNDTTIVYQDGAAPGRIKFKDVTGDGRVSAADRTIIGSPHPKFTGGLDGTYRFRRFDFGATLFGTFGNKVLDAQKYYYVFRTFDENVRKDLLQNSWRPDNPNAKYPRIDVSDNYSSQVSSYYVENGSYLRLRNVQLGYTLPQTRVRFIPAGSRLYIQADNLFTITSYDGLDPSLPPANITGSSGQDVRDQFRGIDQGVYPTSKIFSFGITTTF